MSKLSEKSKKLSTTWKIVIVTGALALIFFGFALGAAFASPAQAEKAVKNIGVVSYTAESKEKIDIADKYYKAVGVNGLGESKNFGAAYIKATVPAELSETLDAAKKEYVRLAIRAVDVAEKRREVDRHTDEDIIELIIKARAAADAYFKGEYDRIETYATLTSYEEKYSLSASQQQSQGGADSEEEPEIELC